jgi:hypothetical protein
MATTLKLFLILTVFCFAAAVLYVLWGIWDPTYGDLSNGQHPEFVGSVALLLVGVLSALITVYLFIQRRAQKGTELPEDRWDAEIDDGDAEQGFFSPWSWWPVSLGASAALMFLGLAIGNWICFIAVPLAAISLIGLLFEYQRGYFGH